MDIDKLTPMMKQYIEIKHENPDALLFFRLGDFYEMFFEDAEIAAQTLNITLTSRGSDSEDKIPMCGVPHHVIDQYLPRLVRAGYKVAICEQLEDPSQAKGIVKRGVVKVVTPGTYFNEQMDYSNNNYLVSIYYTPFGIGLSYLDLGTGEIYGTDIIEGSNSDIVLINELSRINPTEVIVNIKENKESGLLLDWLNDQNIVVNNYDISQTDINDIQIEIKNDYHIETDALLERPYIILSLYMIMQYVLNTQKMAVKNFKPLEIYEIDAYLILDWQARKNLELTETITSGEKKGSLFGVLDSTKTAMGSRLLRKWLEQPLKNIDMIESRLNNIESFFNYTIIREETRRHLSSVYDIDRLLMRFSMNSITPKDLESLKLSLTKLPPIIDLLLQGNKHLINLSKNLNPLNNIVDLLDRAIIEQPPTQIKDGGYIKVGFNENLDLLRNLSTDGKQWLINYETELRAETKIKNLRIRHNKILGYYIEVTKSYVDLVPSHFIRKQTLVGSERFFTEKLKTMEEEIIDSHDKTLRIEAAVLGEVISECHKYINDLQNNSLVLSEIDVFSNLAHIAYINNYNRPTFNSNGVIEIVEGRHPVVEKLFKEEQFIPNNTSMNKTNKVVQIITGPNMAGKSTYMRQTALIVLMAHIGMFVPAQSANICVVDRIFTRIGASDNLYKGQSTFMVEMTEVATILNEASSESLIILDEIGRGTSTYDGLSIAWAVVLYILNELNAKTLFATHYHELTQLEEKEPGVINLAFIAEDQGSDIKFIRKVVEGYSSESYGIQVAKLAGVDSKVINMAWDILSNIECSHKQQSSNDSNSWSLLSYQHSQFIDSIGKINIDEISPMEALIKLNELVNHAKLLGEENE